ncbi:MAG: threonylcarbamoyl-AMP synthase [Chloroflexi bacterium]|nr:threonylcarbamoyl-AMP synthase [Chloroflexota bacterium]
MSVYSVSSSMGNQNSRPRTQVLPANDTEAFAHAVRLLRAGKVIAFPTDTVYGVGASGFNARAIEQLFLAKNRARDKAIPYLLASANDLALVAREVPAVARLLANRFWPGALTLVVPAGSRVPPILVAGGDRVAVRVPAHPTTRALIDALRAPLAATSANLSGARDPATAAEVLAQLTGRIPLILDGGPTHGNVPSTVVDVTTDPPTVRRVGVISIEQLENALGTQVHREAGTQGDK